ncbi:MerR family transcriptional regulator [Nocardia alni]|uniref:DNA polymerase III subunit beta family protein n=1 Tax=Nocardia alni TaxID=2815723 RepID=UPI001C24ED42|nr:MerR family transcriptional regulator [Nocardia alni]
MTESDEFITIGVLARTSGLTSTALRFYDDCGLLPPARVDAATGYRYYSPDQRERAVTIRRLREIGVSLETVAAVLAGDADRAGRLLDEHVADLERRADAAATAVGSIKFALRAGSDPALVSVCAAELADAIDQVRTAVAHDAEIPVLTGIFIEADGDSVVLTATDRYRLTTRTLAPEHSATHPWSLVVRTPDLTDIAARLRDTDRVFMTPTDDSLVLSTAETRHVCPVIDAPFPDYRTMLGALTPPGTRVVVSRDALLDIVQNAGHDNVRCTIAADALVISTAARANADAHCEGFRSSETSADPAGHRIPAVITGSGLTLSFAPTTLSPALRSALGPEIMLDIAGPDQPVVIRSAAAGDLTTLAMPTKTELTAAHA